MHHVTGVIAKCVKPSRIKLRNHDAVVGLDPHPADYKIANNH